MNNKLSWIGGLAVMLGLNIGGALWSKPVAAASIGGPGTAIVTILGMGVVALAAPGYLALTKTWSLSPGHYYYNSRMLLPENKKLSHFIGWCILWPSILMSGFVILQILVIAGASYLNAFFPSVSTQIFTILLLVSTVCIVWFGIQAVGRIEIVLSAFLLVSIGVILSLGFVNIDPSRLTPVFPASLTSTLSTMGVMLTTFITGLYIIDFGDDIENPEKAFGRILFINTGAVALIGTGVILVSVGMVPYQELANQTLRVVTSQYLTPELLVVSTIAAMVAGVTSNIAILSMVTRYVKAVANDGILPTWLAAENKHGEPKYVLVILGAASVVGVLVNIPLNDMIQASAIGNLSLLTITCLTASRLPSTRPELFETGPMANSQYLTPRSVRWFSRAAAVVLGTLVMSMASESPTGVQWYLTFLVIGVGIYGIQTLRGTISIETDSEELGSPASVASDD
ncbi:APC family permease [Haloferax sp. ATB1]|uniref:amino acid permease n=1 Tax=Haloferax sp. ATB1 TaxID=1508454 RepID=UPI0009E453CC|nr:APC family permease [Haloferax sp. ATB1]